MADEAKMNDRKRKKAYFLKAAQGKKFKRGHILEAGLKGFLLTCNNREKDAVREAYNILNEYTEDCLDENNKNPKNDPDNAEEKEEESEEEEDIETALAKEVSSLKKKNTSERRFQVVDSGANNCVFIKTTLENPDQLLHRVFTDLHESQKSKSRFIMRFMPVIGTCRTEADKIMKLGSDKLPQYFGTGEARTYCVIVKVRNNNQFSRHQVLPVLREVIQELNPNHDFDGDNPDYVISVDVIKTVCCMSVMRNYFKFRKYNMQEVVKTSSEDKSELPRGAETVLECANETVANGKGGDVSSPEELKKDISEGNELSEKEQCNDSQPSQVTETPPGVIQDSEPVAEIQKETVDQTERNTSDENFQT